MKNRILFLVVCLCTLGSTTSCYGQKGKESAQPRAIKDLVVAFYKQDSLKLAFEYYAVRDNLMKDKQTLFTKELDKMVEDYQNYIQRNEKKARQGLLSQDQMEKIQEQAIEKEGEIQRFEQNIGGKLEEEMIQELDEIGLLLEEHSAVFCKERGIDILLIHAPGGQIGYITSELNVTADYIDYLNKMVPVEDKKNKK